MRQPRLPAAFVLLALLGLAGTLAPAAARPAPDDWLAISDRLAPAGTGTDFTPHGTQPGLIYDMLPPETQCSTCHAACQNDPASAPTFRPFTSWGGSMMANATRDPVFWAALDVANHDVPGSGDYCLRCHTPRGWYSGRVVKAGFGDPNNDVTLGAAGCLLSGQYDSEDDLGSDFGGVTCHYCHRLMPQGPGGEPGYVDNGNAWVDDQPCANTGGGPCRRGPYDYDSSGPTPPHEWTYSEYHTESAVCGVCHNVSSPDTDAGPLKTLKLADGTDTALPFPIERTFAEWQQSSYAQTSGGETCQGCHMPSSEDADATACSLSGYPSRTGDLPVHEFVGGNTWVPGIIKGQYAAGIYANGGFDRAPLYDQTIEWARRLLGTAASLDTTITGYAAPGAGDGTLNVQVKVTNLSGHKLPTGYAEGRRMWLNLQVHDAGGALVFESAAYDAANGVLTADPQARVYETLQGIWNAGSGRCEVADADGDPMFHFVLNDCIAKDNRIPPLGFAPATADDPNGYAVRPVGTTYPETAPGSGVLVNYYTATYAVPVPAGTVGPLTATARLYYQTASRDYVEFLRDEAAENGTPGENAMCMGASSRPFTVGPQDKTRGRYLYDLWNDPAAGERIFADGFDGSTPAAGYGKSPPELMQTASATTSP